MSVLAPPSSGGRRHRIGRSFNQEARGALFRVRRCDHGRPWMTTEPIATPSPPARSTPGRSPTSDRRRLAADLPDLDLRPGGRRAAAQRVRVRAVAEPDPRAARARGRGPRGRHARHRVRVSGSAATAAIAQLAAAGEEILVGDDVYGGTFRYFERVHRLAGAASARYVDLAAAPGRAVGGAQRARRASCGSRRRPTRCSRSPTSRRPRRIAPRARGAGRPPAAPRDRQHVRVAGDPAAAGAGRGRRVPLRDQVPRRALGHGARGRGHVRRRGGARLRFLQNAMGGVPGPFDCFLVLRGLRTLHLRMARHSANGLAVARFLATRDRRRRRSATRGSTSAPHAHPRAEVASRQMRLGDEPAFGGMVSFVPAPGGATRPDGGGAGGRRLPSRRACSPWPSRWVAWSR